MQDLKEISVKDKTISDELLGPWTDKRYTYVALELGKALSTLVGWRLHGNVHVSLGYLPTMQTTERETTLQAVLRGRAFPLLTLESPAPFSPAMADQTAAQTLRFAARAMQAVAVEMVEGAASGAEGLLHPVVLGAVTAEIRCPFHV